MTTGVALFLFLGAGAVALFTFLSVTRWTTTQSEERKAIERLALLRQLADAPAESARLVIEQLREEDARRELRRREKGDQRRRDSLQAGVLLMAIGVGLSTIALAVDPEPGTWTVGLIPMLMGLVIAVFALAGGRADHRRP